MGIGGLYAIAATDGFADTLARGLWQEAGEDPMVLARMSVLLPTRRAVRTLRDSFLRLGNGRPMLLPSLRPVGDIDDDEGAFGGLDGAVAAGDLPPAVPGLRRQLLLTQLVQRFLERKDSGSAIHAAGVDHAALLAGELARFLDQVHTEQVSYAGLAGLARERYATHWQEVLEFLSIASEFWPAMLAEEGAMEAPLRHAALVERLTALWAANPPEDPVIVAGSTGSIPATARLMGAVLGLPRGSVVLPGLDRDADAATWSAIEGDSGHAQHNLALLLQRLGRTREEVQVWPVAGERKTHSARARLIQEVLRPAETTEAWRRLAETDQELLSSGTEGLSVLSCPSHHEEAETIALLLREALEDQTRTAALVTPDRALARRVKAALRRWEVEVDDSAGQPLAATLPMTFWLATADMAAEACAPVPLLAALKHPLAAGGMSQPRFRRRVRTLEREVLRGPRPAPGPAGVLAAVDEAFEAEDRDDMRSWIDRLAEPITFFSELLRSDEISLIDLLSAHNAVAEALAATDEESGDKRLWAGEAGEDAANFLAELAESARDFPRIDGRDYLSLLEALLVGRVHRPRYGTHPRLAILGPLEGRLQQYDLLILGGLNEGTWPPDPGADPWMSRPMRAEFGLPAPERRIGLSAHDFQMAASAPEVVLTRAERVEGAPTVASRWWLRMETVLRALQLTEKVRLPVADFPHWQQALDLPRKVDPVKPPTPRPPLAARPRRFSVTEIETWVRDPYAIYAKKVLGLRALDPLDADPGAADRGTMIHRALELFTNEFPKDIPPGALERLIEIGRGEFAREMAHPSVQAFWWPRFERIAEWFVETERVRRSGIDAIWTEKKGHVAIRGLRDPVDLNCEADRIERLADGGFAIVDFKTGAPPTESQVTAGYSPQLPLEALILSMGGFDGLPEGAVEALEYWRLSGGDPAGERKAIKASVETLVTEAEEGLLNLIRTFDDPETPYRSRPAPEYAPRYSDYEHLARVKEWSAGGELS
ncbi:MAG: double-strand break repair protein AddB [Nisaea sp.]|uniref:double-strand break repair protein AddB n=1 Tax=Nisaea sp. TaxID=2024842 RepID=UPI001B04A82B|nr:double-strand break repair protein AddB [Nisaea sp.]MBO6559417.1 double-strand break repair protein AddB [Nisaea sp.]